MYIQVNVIFFIIIIVGNQNVSKGNGDGKVVNSDEIAEKLDELSVKDELVTHTTDKNNSSLNVTNKDKDKDKPDR